MKIGAFLGCWIFASAQGACTSEIEKAFQALPKPACGCAAPDIPRDTTPSQQPTFFVFISARMPLSSIQRLAQEVTQAGGALVLRGLMENSFTKTAAWIQQVGVGVRVDPRLFKAFQITRVPAFVVLQEPFTEIGALEKVPEHDILYGHISVRAALEKIAAVNPYAATLLERL